ncbi:MAG: hypothetical protein ABIT71_09550 [Vicinamibacteraceae bacterium]
MTWPNMARLRDHLDEPSDPTDVANVGVLALLLVLLLVAGLSMALRWSVDGLQAPQVATAAE